MVRTVAAGEDAEDGGDALPRLAWRLLTRGS